jgi:dimethylglycine dehydrogenase
MYVAPHEQAALYHALAEAGEEFGMRPFGMRAMMSLRLEKSFGSWLREYRPDYTAAETGMDRFISFKKNDFIGRDAALKEKEDGVKRRLCTFKVDAADADVVADEPIWKDGEVIGFVTSGGYAHFCETSVAIGFVPTGMIAEGAEFEIEILGEMKKATLYTDPLFDPQGERMRM